MSQTYYTTDGSTPTTASSTFAAPFTVDQTSTVRFFSTDVAGNAEQPKSQQILVDGAPPTVSLTAPTSGATIKKGSRQTAAANASDLGTGSGAPSGIARVSFYLDGTLLGTATTAPYQISWRSSARGMHTLTAVARDVAGNSTTSIGVSVTVK